MTETEKKIADEKAAREAREARERAIERAIERDAVPATHPPASGLDDKAAADVAYKRLNVDIGAHAGTIMSLISKLSRHHAAITAQGGAVTPPQLQEWADLLTEMIAVGTALANLLPHVQPPEASGPGTARPSAGTGERTTTAHVPSTSKR